jgi:hypothetical protein
MDADTTQRILYGPNFLRALSDDSLIQAMSKAGVVPAVTYAPVDELGRIGEPSARSGHPGTLGAQV